MMTSNM